jgi:hypothetical protein
MESAACKGGTALGRIRWGPCCIQDHYHQRQTSTGVYQDVGRPAGSGLFQRRHSHSSWEAKIPPHRLDEQGLGVPTLGVLVRSLMTASRLGSITRHIMSDI